MQKGTCRPLGWAGEERASLGVAQMGNGPMVQRLRSKARCLLAGCRGSPNQQNAAAGNKGTGTVSQQGHLQDPRVKPPWAKDTDTETGELVPSGQAPQCPPRWTDQPSLMLEVWNFWSLVPPSRSRMMPQPHTCAGSAQDLVPKRSDSPLTNYILDLHCLMWQVVFFLWEGESGNKRMERGDGSIFLRLLKLPFLHGNVRKGCTLSSRCKMGRS